MRVDGSCHCGAVQYEAELDPARVGICHCTDCQQFSSSAFRTSALVGPEAFRLLSGSPTLYEKISENGSRRSLAFCGQCGTHLYGTTPGAAASFYSVRVGTLAQRAELAPRLQVWCRSELPWLTNLADVRRIPEQ